MGAGENGDSGPCWGCGAIAPNSVTSEVSGQGTVNTMTTENIAVSKLLKKARKAQGLTVKAVAQEICVQSSYLKAIESGEYEKLPAQPFSVGFVRSYACALGEDADKIVASFKDECGLSKLAAVAVPKLQQKKAPTKLPAWLSPIAGLVGASLCWVALGGSLSGVALVADAESDIATEKAQLAALQSEIVGVAIGENIADPVHAALAVQTSNELAEQPQASMSLFIPAAYAGTETSAGVSASNILLEASEDSWVRVARPDGTELWSGILRAGQSYRPHEAGEMLLTTSNAGGLALKQNDAAALYLGARGEIVTDYSLGHESQLAQGGVDVAASQ
ncbi:MAG: DUF4115 domain-containing protein [Gammaproteobacteria bacterium]|nr:DUF4115 domain-containing protein [Gammaproteobacteria bacterium]